MGSAAATLLILAVLFTSAFIMFQTKLHGDVVAGGAVRESALMHQQRAATSISIESTEAYSVFRCDTTVRTEIKNTGATRIEHFELMDIFTWYTADSGEQLIERLNYTEGNLHNQEWAVPGLDPLIIGAIWDPGETVSISWRLLRPQKEGTFGYITVVTPNGVSDSAYVDFTDVANSDCRFLHNDPTPPIEDTASQPLLSMEGGIPTTTTLFNYDNDRDANPGLTLIRSQNGLTETLTTKYQVWRTGVLETPIVINGDVLVDIYAALNPVVQGELGVLVAYLRDYEGASYTEIGESAVFARDWQSGSSGFVERMTLIKNVNHTIPAGHELEIRLQVDAASHQEMTVAYDTQQQSSLIDLFYRPPTASALFYLHNNPTPPVADTSRQAILPLDETAATGSVLYQYGTPNNNPGLLLKGTDQGLAETIFDKFQVWQTSVLAEDLVVQGDVLVDLWAGIRGFQADQSGALTIFLRDFDGSSYTEIANGSIFAEDWQQGSRTFVPQTIIIPDVDYTVPAGHQLEARVIADTIKSSKDMWLAYDTTLYPTVIKLP